LAKLTFVNEKNHDGSSYVGEKAGDLKYGRGQFYNADGSYYDGEWKNDKKHGNGIFYSKDMNIVYDG